MLAAVNFASPVLWAVIIGWVLTVVLHEFAHGLVGYLGGDYTIRERGGLTLNPLQYIHPIFSIVLPAVFVLIGGIPLPGGATYIRTDLLRNRFWRSLTSLAGPLMNFLIFLLLLLPFHPAVGWIDFSEDPAQWTTFQQFMGALAFLQIFSVFLNLLPIPPLDGFNAISPYLPEEMRHIARQPAFQWSGLILLFVIINNTSWLFTQVLVRTEQLLRLMNFREDMIYFLWNSFSKLFQH